MLAFGIGGRIRCPTERGGPADRNGAGAGASLREGEMPDSDETGVLDPLHEVDRERAPRRLFRWAFWSAWASFSYLGSFLAVILLDDRNLIASRWYPPLEALYFPFIWALHHSRTAQGALDTFVKWFLG